MTITINATYENGVLKPESPLPLSEHEKVRVTVEPQVGIDFRGRQIGTEPARPSLAEQLIALANALPEEVVARLPTDGASQHDHYIYGTPKRPDLPE
jgi:predicted DNA-binding antitoxin AbrB/MazE fold protein